MCMSILLVDENPSVNPGTSPENTVAVTSTQKRAVSTGIVQTSSLREVRAVPGWSWEEEFIVKNGLYGWRHRTGYDCLVSHQLSFKTRSPAVAGLSPVRLNQSWPTITRYTRSKIRHSASATRLSQRHITGQLNFWLRDAAVALPRIRRVLVVQRAG